MVGDTQHWMDIKCNIPTASRPRNFDGPTTTGIPLYSVAKPQWGESHGRRFVQETIMNGQNVGALEERHVSVLAPICCA